MTDVRSRLSGFFRELRRRRVIRVAIGYAGVAFVVAQAAELILPALNYGDDAVNWTIRLLVVFFPAVIVLAWIYDLTPAGVRRTASLEAEEAARQATMAGTLPIVRRDRLQNAVAVLPFANLSGDASLDYFGDGLTEELTTNLSRVPGLRVASRTSCFAMKRLALDVSDVASRLGVRFIVEGSVRVDGDRVHLSVRLVDAEDGFARWSETWERPLAQIFAIQQQVAHAIADHVNPDGRLAHADPRVTTRNVDALQAFMQGRFHLNRRTERDLLRAADFFTQATRIDPDYASAHAGIADAYAILLDYGSLAPAQALERSRTAAERALELDTAAGEAWTSLALVRQFEWRWDEAERAFRRSIELQPDYSVAHQRYALHLAWMGRPDDALVEARAAERLDPLSPLTKGTVGWVWYYARRFDLAIEQLESTLEMEPGFATARIALARARLQAGDIERSIADHRRAVTDSADAPSAIALLSLAQAGAGRIDEARATAERLAHLATMRYVSPYYLAIPEIGFGNADRALDYLEAGLASRAAQMIYLRAEPIVDPLRPNLRFHHILEQLAFPSL
jgi:TolB-like protein/tetratricopeptide (TPR) repeat protein